MAWRAAGTGTEDAMAGVMFGGGWHCLKNADHDISRATEDDHTHAHAHARAVVTSTQWPSCSANQNPAFGLSHYLYLSNFS